MKKSKKIISIVLAVMMIVGCMQCTLTAFAAGKQLDIAFVIDTTGSMDDDIGEVKGNMKQYLNNLEEAGNDFRIAIVDYRDFASRTGDSSDYPYKVQLDFTNNHDSIIAAINSLYADGGGDINETICSALIDGLSELSWRSTAGKAAILMGDAPALDPEPITGYTKKMAVNKLKTNKTGYEEDIRATSMISAMSSSKEERSAVTLFAVATSGSSSTASDFSYLAEETGGTCYTNISTYEINEVIEEIIETIPEVVEEPSIFEIIWNWIVDFFKSVWDFITNIF